MWGENWLGRTARKIAAGAVESGLEKLAAAVRSKKSEGGVPVAVVLPSGSRIAFGDVPPRVTLIVRDEATLAEFASPTLATLGEAFIDGRLDVEGDIAEAIKLAERLAENGGAPVAARVAAAMNRHTPKQDRADITHHYDVGNDFYRLWLDERMVYSCAYFRTGDESIDQAQVAKLDHICRKLRLAPGERLLDIGCGWGGLILHAVQNYGVRAVGITLSQAQLDVARERIARAGVTDRCEALLLDYREAPARFGAESFDKASSIGMFEHVGLRNMAQYCTVVRD
ncbi:MAG TPA: cyclopropane-fatty-acyl-phospholipid synthase family protein, partial [Burkholderiaceae bacterium]|nr:cyclopropane-fatty-acyl-phospholipid synthase family protein [Burkholderiaceae bacterium]